MKRVLCLYRVSTLKQVDNKDDIPMQRRECLDFINRMDDWVFYDERMEKGVSGYKVSANDRDIIAEIREMAENKLFDVLLVFMFDRLGRKEDETPFLVKWFVDHGIEVWSTREGQQRLDNQVDRLMNYMRFWAASGESEKTSLRVKAAHKQMTEDGVWRGGGCPYGYKLVRLGRIGKRNRPLYDIVIDEQTAPIVREVFDLIVRQGYGTHRAANYLNDKYPNPNKIWVAQTIRTMIRNPIYTGRLHMNDVLSEPIEELRIVSDEDVEFGMNAIARRIPRRNPEIRAEEDSLLPGTIKSKTSVFGAYLLTGIAYCAHCGKKLVGTYHTKQVGDLTYHRPVYRCYNGEIRAKNCTGPRTYSGRKIESAVMEVVREYFQTVKQSVDDVWKEKARKRMRQNALSRVKDIEATMERLQKDQENLKNEVLRVIGGTSTLDRELLKTMLDENKRAQIQAEEDLQHAKEEVASEETRIKLLATKYKNISDWADQFEDADVDCKKMILARLIERVEIGRGYEIEIKFYINPEDFSPTESPEKAC